MDASVTNIDELREFASYLQWLSTSMVEEFSKARGKMTAINENWRDDENMRFMEVFSESVEQINKIAEQMDNYSQYVNKKCDILDMYNNASL